MIQHNRRAEKENKDYSCPLEHNIRVFAKYGAGTMHFPYAQKCVFHSCCLLSILREKMVKCVLDLLVQNYLVIY